MKHIFSWVSIAIIVIVLVYLFFFQRAHAPIVIDDVPLTNSSAQGKLSPEMAHDAQQMIEVATPLPNTAITSPIILTGRARGPWYFEASFPIELRDANNVLITTAIAQAQWEWMTENMVPFTATLTFPAQPVGSQGMLVFKNDNPSGEPQNSMMFDVPVTF